MVKYLKVTANFSISKRKSPPPTPSIALPNHQSNPGSIARKADVCSTATMKTSQQKLLHSSCHFETGGKSWSQITNSQVTLLHLPFVVVLFGVFLNNLQYRADYLIVLRIHCRSSRINRILVPDRCIIVLTLKITNSSKKYLEN